MSQFPYQLDSDVDLPRVDNNITEIGGLAINAIRAAIFAIEADIGIGAAGAAGSIAQRLNVSLDANGNILPSALVNLLTIVQITDAQVASGAGIQESKLNLAYSTASLHLLYEILKTSVDNLNGWLSITGVELQPHIDGTNYNHSLSAILVESGLPTENPVFVKTAPTTFQSAGTNVVNRNTTNLETLLEDINTDLVVHEKSDSTANVVPTSGGTVPPLNFAHVAAGIYVNPDSFTTIPQANDNVQSIVDYIDGSSLLLLGSRVQNFYSNGVARTSRSSSLLSDGYGAPIVPPTPVTAYFLGVPPGPASSSPVDSFMDGDDVIIFDPSSSQLSAYQFDAQFAQVQPGNLLTINYGTGISYQFVVDSVKSLVSGSTRTYGVRINGKNSVGDGYTDGYAIARIDNALFNRNKYAVLATSRAPNLIGAYESLIVANPRSAVALGNGFNTNQLNATHYNLYLTLLPNGDLTNVFPLPAIDVTGNQGATPGTYTLDTVINAINTAFRAPGYNYRFTAFEFEGQIGLALDPYNNASFSIISGVTDGYGNYTSSSNLGYPNNVVDNFNLIDPMGFGLNGANVASQPPSASYISIPAAEFAPILLFYPLKRNYFYTNGSEIDLLNSDPLTLNNIEDVNGDGYWPATISSVTIGVTVTAVYKVNLDLAESGLAIGKTVVVQPTAPTTNTSLDVNYGRFIISNVVFSPPCMNEPAYTSITVYDAVHGTGISPYATLPVGSAVNVYFCDDSVSFDAENVADGITAGPFKRFFEVYVDGNGHTTTHERARFLTTLGPTDVAQINFYDVSPKLRGYLTSGNIKSIALSILSYNSTTGIFTGQLSNGASNFGPLTTGKVGEIVRFYDATNVDYIDFIYALNTTPISNLSVPLNIQLFNSLELNQQFMLTATCQVSDTTRSISYLKDGRQFGNVSEDQLSDSALDFITSNPRHTLQNGIVRGFDLFSPPSSNPVLTESNIANYDGGLALVNGNLLAFNPFSVDIPLVQDNNGGSPISGVLFAICANEESEIQLIPLTDYNPSVNTINNPNRLLQLYNPVNSAAYYVDSTIFSTLISTRKDLTVLWLVNVQTTVTGSTITSYTLTFSDARKYVVDINANMPLVLTSANSQGNFQSLSALSTWATYNASFQNNVLLRGPLTNENFPNETIPGGVNYTGDGSTITLNSSVTLSSNTSFTNCDIIITSNTGFIIPGTAKNISFNNCTFTYTPPTPTPSGNLINSGAGAIYSLVFGLLNISITGCTFTTNTSARPPFISLVYSTAPTTYAQTIHITNNKFYNTSAVDDTNAVIAFTSIATGTQPVEGLKLIDCVIDKNLCDKNQLIAITAATSGFGTITCAIVPIATKITNNSCGAISITGAADTDRNYETGTTEIAYDKGYGIVVADNTCRFIGMLDSTGVSTTYLTYYTATFPIAFDTCSMVIQRNQCSWIQLSPFIATAITSTNAYQQNAAPLILDNSLRAYQTAFLGIFSSTSSDFINAAILLTPIANIPQAIIRGNTIMQGSALNNFNFLVTYDYDNCINVGTSAIIDANIFNNLQVTGNRFSGNMIYILLGGGFIPNITITNNQFYRNSVVITSYINFVHTVDGVVSNNFFDSTTVDNASNTTLIVGSLTNIVFGPNYNYGAIVRSIAQPIVFYPSTYVTNGFEVITTPGQNGYFEMAKVLNGATLASITFTYVNSVTVTTASTISLYSFFSTGGIANRTNITGIVPMSTIVGPNSTTVLISGLTINDSLNTYSILVSNNDGSASVFWYAPILNFTGLSYPGQN